MIAALLVAGATLPRDLAGACVRSVPDSRVAVDLLDRRLGERTGRPLRRDGCTPSIVVAPLTRMRAALPATKRGTWDAVAPATVPDQGFAVRDLEGTLAITAGNRRGLVYGVGWLLRTVETHAGQALLTLPARLDEAPAHPVRMTQIGYRAKNNSYDAWTPAMFERRIEDFALFGASGVQMIAPISDDAPGSPLFPQPPLETLAGIGRIAHRLGLDFALYYPELGAYDTAGAVADETARFAQLIDALPPIDALYVPGGDPGHTAPGRLFQLVAAQARRLRSRYPRAHVWISTQGFDAKGFEAFYRQLDEHPDWLSGVFIGPQSRDPIPVQRARIAYPVQLYPDIGHTMHAQYPVPQWSPAFALTQGREPIDPRPMATAAIFAAFATGTTGFVTYSEGVNDDFNQMLWFRLGWRPTIDPAAVADEYARMFVGDPHAAALPAALERNWAGDPAGNAGIDAMLALADAIRPAIYADWRLDSLRYRAVYDALVRRRLIAARARQANALTALAAGKDSITAVTSARTALAVPDGPDIAALRSRLSALAARLFAAARLQLSVARYGASDVERGANLDRAGVDLNDRVWLERGMAAALALANEPARRAALAGLTDHERRAEGALYDDLGDPEHEPHLVRGAGFAADPQLYATAVDAIADRTPEDAWRLSQISYAESLYDAPIRLHYEGLDRRRGYRIVVTYAGEDYALPIRLVADGRYEIHSPLTRATNPTTVSYPIPRAATADGTLDLAWTGPAGAGGSGRGHQVAETWLIPDFSNGAHP